MTELELEQMQALGLGQVVGQRMVMGAIILDDARAKVSMDEETLGVESFGEVDYSAAKFATIEHVFILCTVAWDLE